MNRSGQAVAPLANFFRIPVENILVAHDELDMLPGVCKIKQGGGHGGHNGLRDIISLVWLITKNFIGYVSVLIIQVIVIALLGMCLAKLLLLNKT